MPMITNFPPTTLSLIRKRLGEGGAWNWRTNLGDAASLVLPGSSQESLSNSLLNVGMPIAYHSEPAYSFEGWTSSVGNEIKQNFHAGTKRAAMDRLFDTTKGRPPHKRIGVLHKVDIRPRKPYLPEGRMLNELDAQDRTLLFEINAMKSVQEDLLSKGYDVVPYRNAIEGAGSISYMVLDPSSAKVLESKKINLKGYVRKEKGLAQPSWGDPKLWGKEIPVGGGVSIEKPIKGTIKAPIGDFDELIDNGINIEYPDIASSIEKYSYHNNIGGIKEAMSNPNYPGYKKDLHLLLDGLFPEGRIPVRRIKGYAGGTGQGSGSHVSVSITPGWGGDRAESFLISTKDVSLAGYTPEGELIVKKSALK